ncbi:hypothetical protein OHA02_51685 [Streptomyces phaeochromogenes]|nr:hypothetical protein [Streptomyces phaeochromogenes]MCX4564570.1 hypothetical protein [Streptomyces phaeochromogenes]
MEEDAENGARELARLLLQGHFDLRARREEAELSALAAGGPHSPRAGPGWRRSTGANWRPWSGR